jgi:glycosyltransferase involved in cell wall biosynthesis
VLPGASPAGAVAAVRAVLFGGAAAVPAFWSLRARGVPVACSDGGALAEVAGDAALRFDPRSQEAIASAITRLLSDEALAAHLRARGPTRATAFTWEHTAVQTLAVYERALRAGP